jgi:hypothetical protein
MSFAEWIVSPTPWVMLGGVILGILYVYGPSDPE